LDGVADGVGHIGLYGIPDLAVEVIFSVLNGSSPGVRAGNVGLRRKALGPVGYELDQFESQ
jgi:hypothetical protein